MSASPSAVWTSGKPKACLCGGSSFLPPEDEISVPHRVVIARTQCRTCQRQWLYSRPLTPKERKSLRQKRAVQLPFDFDVEPA